MVTAKSTIKRTFSESYKRLSILPFVNKECTLKEAADLAGVASQTIRLWAHNDKMYGRCSIQGYSVTSFVKPTKSAPTPTKAHVIHREEKKDCDLVKFLMDYSVPFTMTSMADGTVTLTLNKKNLI